MSTTCTEAGLDELLGPSLTEDQAREIYREGEEAVVLGFLIMARKLAALSPSKPPPTAPSGMVPGYQKPATRVRGKKSGGRPGREGHHRAPPARIDRKREHRLPCCPDCQGRLKRSASTRPRFIEDIPEGITPIVTEHTIRRDWCPRCKKLVEPKVPDALPGATLGNRTAVMTGWMHYGLGNTISQIVNVFNYHLQMKLTRGGLVNLWRRLQDALFPWYEQIQAEALKSAVLHADETSWRVSGKTHWLWAFANHDLTYYMIDRSRGEPALLRFFIEEFDGTLVSDFWALTTQWSAQLARVAWSISCAICIPWSTTRKADLTGRSFPKSCGDCWAMRSACDNKSPTCRRKTSTPGGNGLENAWTN